ncbi:hypothetical protein KSF_071430 [Reticulibacter mediterranei]|uniref:Uncharacterized protein n=1 Tax=Reticulibacter mediterranei TaxID=2778369 RepID=A0A8J3IUF9_9CHLR|nr:hypothetical protein KSF_071430 [Reticulibacter mediterranei]
MYHSYEALRIVHEQTVREAQDRERIYVELQCTRLARPGLRNLIGLLHKSFPVRTQQQYAEFVCSEEVL